MSDAIITELLDFLKHDRPDVQKQAYQIISRQSGNQDFLTALVQKPSVISILINSLGEASDNKSEAVAVLPYILTTLTNISTSVTGTNASLTTGGDKLIPSLVTIIRNSELKYADCAAGLLANLTRSSVCCNKVLNILSKDKNTLPVLLIVATTTGYNSAGNSLDLLMSVVENISQLKEGRELLLDRERAIIQRVLPFTQYEGSDTRRRGAVACLYNCCFNKEDHLWLLSPDVDLASYLCLPLVGGGDSYRDDEIEDLSDLLVYPHDDKKREPNEDIRLMIIQCFTQLCATRPAREELRKQSVYSVLREYHTWEKSTLCLPLLEDLINILIKTEDEIGHSDLTNVDVPEDMAKKFDKELENDSCDKVNSEEQISES